MQHCDSSYRMISEGVHQKDTHETYLLKAVSRLKKQYDALGCYIGETPIDLYPTKNLKLQMLSSAKNSNYCVFLLQSYKVFAGKNGNQNCVCKTIDSNGMSQIIFEGDRLEYLKENIDQILCCKISDINLNRPRGNSLINIHDYILQIESIHVMVQNIDEMKSIKDKLQLSEGNTSLILHIDGERLNIGKFVCSVEALQCFTNMKWVASV